MSVAAGPPIHCSTCDAVCCRQLVILQPGDRIPAHLTQWLNGQQVMARDEEGWCQAVDGARMCCSIYSTRPRVCRQFAMAGSDCRQLRQAYAGQTAGHDLTDPLLTKENP
ncbi:MAG: YkgJ family cysteine cluster protein [Xanthomonadales bacterium]|nr:YkgJ family cysteine cluster protein [Xanthomonadales bacterium]